MGVTLSVLLAVGLSLIQETPRVRGLPVSVLFGLVYGLVAFLSHLSSMRSDLYGVGASAAAVWAAGMIAAAVVMYSLKKQWVGGGNPVTPQTS
jgi:hypothetical protein